MPKDISTKPPQHPQIPTRTAIRLLEEGGATIDTGSVPDPDVLQICRTKVTRDGDVLPIKTFRNLCLILDQDHRLKGRIRFNELLGQPTIDEVPTTDLDDLKIAAMVERIYQIQFEPTKIANAVRFVADRHSHHPVCDYLDGLEWDEQSRLDRLLVTYFGAEDTKLNRVIGRKFAISMVARARKPGCKVDTCLILAGRQGIRKSSGLRALSGEEYFSDTLLDVRHKDALMQIRGVWCYELSELDSMRRSEVSAVKAFVSAQFDRYRSSYGRHVEKHPRTGVFVGTSNETEFLTDSTGSRRWWVARCNKVNLEGIQADRDQIWAEADTAYKAREPWWLDDQADVDLNESNAVHHVDDPWAEIIDVWLESTTGPVRLENVMRGALHIETDRMKTADQWRVGRVLRQLGLTKRQIMKDGKRSMMWVRR